MVITVKINKKFEVLQSNLYLNVLYANLFRTFTTKDRSVVTKTIKLPQDAEVFFVLTYLFCVCFFLICKDAETFNATIVVLNTRVHTTKINFC